VAFQPIIDVHSGRTVGAEALLRWQHPEFGQLCLEPSLKR
jgi:EAL domain-containing protein (putative c-di-GMP-specific phosphodiesterase class I)